MMPTSHYFSFSNTVIVYLKLMIAACIADFQDNQNVEIKDGTVCDNLLFLPLHVINLKTS